MITELHISNLMRLREVSIYPDNSPLVEITGSNGMGKSAVLQAGKILLGGGKFVPADPIRHGEDSAELSLVFSVPCADCDGEGCAACDNKGHIPKYRASREIKNGKSELVLTSPDGKYRFKDSPQALLREWFTDVGFDPLTFATMTRTERDKKFMKLVGLDFTEVDARIASLFVERTDNNRDARGAEAQLEELPEVEAPDAEVKLSDLLAERDAAEAAKQKNVNRESVIALQTEKVAGFQRRVDELKAQAAAMLEERLAAAEKLLEVEGSAVLAVPDIVAITAKINSAEDTNRRVRLRQARDKKLSEVEALRKHGNDLHHQIEALRSDRRLMIESAEMPLKEFSYDVDQGVMYNGVVYDQASQSEQILASTALGFKINPGKVAFIKEGALLDTERRAELARFVKEQGGQVFIEIVTDGEDVGFVIEDGALAGTEEPQPAVA